MTALYEDDELYHAMGEVCDIMLSKPTAPQVLTEHVVHLAMEHRGGLDAG